MTGKELAEKYWEWFQNEPARDRLIEYVESADKTLLDAMGDVGAAAALFETPNPVFTEFRILVEANAGGQHEPRPHTRAMAFELFTNRLRKTF